MLLPVSEKGKTTKCNSWNVSGRGLGAEVNGDSYINAPLPTEAHRPRLATQANPTANRFRMKIGQIGELFHRQELLKPQTQGIITGILGRECHSVTNPSRSYFDSLPSLTTARATAIASATIPSIFSLAFSLSGRTSP